MLRFQIVQPFLKHYKHFITDYSYRHDNGCIEEGVDPLRLHVYGARIFVLRC